MKTKKFKFRQTVWSMVKTEYSYKIEAKTYEEAVEQLKEVFARKLESGKENNPFKKLNPKKEVKDTQVVLPEMLGKATLTVEHVSKSKKKEIVVELYNNQDKTWNQNTLVFDKEQEGKSEASDEE
jgi:hypothetical protein